MPRSPLPLLKCLNNPQHKPSPNQRCNLLTSPSAPTSTPLRTPHPFPHFPRTAPFPQSHFYSTFLPPQPPFPITPLCPSPTCACALTPSDLDIDREGALSGTVPAYAQHVLISTGREDWASRITDDDDPHAALTRVLKGELGVGGRFHDPYRPVLITHSSFPPSPSALSSPKQSSAFLFPSFRYVPDLGPDPEAFIRTYIRPVATRAHEEHNSPDKELTLPPAALEKPNRSVRGTAPSDSHSHSHVYSRPVDELVILICGHASRDRRCGVMGPLLRAQFITALKAYGFSVASDFDPADQDQSRYPFPSPSPQSTSSSATPALFAKTARVGLTSHIGGHRFAGNVIIYVPPAFDFDDSGETKGKEAMGIQLSAARSSSMSRLQGMGIWYGRVEPRHVEGIVAETIRGGRVIGELFRGAVSGRW